MKKTSFLFLTACLLSFSMIATSCGGSDSGNKVSINVTNGTGGGTYTVGTSVTITANVPQYQDFDYWTMNDMKVSNANPYTFNAVQNATYTAFFKGKEVSITVTNGTGGGTYTVGTNATITADVPTDKDFDYWSKDGTKVSETNPYTFAVMEPGTYTACFKNKNPILTVTNGNGSGQYVYGELVTVTPNVPNNKIFAHWKVDGEIVSYDSSYTFSILKDTTIKACFDDELNMASYTKTVTHDFTKGSFKILQLTDIQLHDGEDIDLALDILDQLHEKEDPDMIVFLGDLINDDKVEKSVVNYKAIVNKIDSFNIPWAPIFGNHDYEDYNTPYKPSMKTTTSDDLITYWTSKNNCLFTRGPSSIDRKSNYVVNIKNQANGKIEQSLILMDSGLAGLVSSHDVFYNNAIKYCTELNGGDPIESTVYSHVAIPQYGDALNATKPNEFRDVKGCYGRDPTDLASGSRTLFPLAKAKGTARFICGHDHENAYYLNHEGVDLIYSMKSSQGDKYTCPAETGGSVLEIKSGEIPSFYYSKANVAYNIGNELTVNCDTTGYWRYTGNKLCFDVEFNDSSSAFKFALYGTNYQRYGESEKTRQGAWNRLTGYVSFSASDKTASAGTLSLISGNKYHYEIDFTDFSLNKGGGEVADGSETLRLVYFESSNKGSEVNADISNFLFIPEEITETNQVDLANAAISPIPDALYNYSRMIRPDLTVKVGGTTLKPITDYLAIYENNTEIGTANVTVVPSGKGAHKWKGSISTTFNIISNQ